MNYFNISINEALQEKHNLTNAIKSVSYLLKHFLFTVFIIVWAPKDTGAPHNQETEIVANKIWYQNIHSDKYNSGKHDFYKQNDRFLSNWKISNRILRAIENMSSHKSTN